MNSFSKLPNATIYLSNLIQTGERIGGTMPDPKHEILVVDDEDAVRNSLALLLQSSGYHVATAINGFDALLHLKIKSPAVVLSDLNMPQMSGF